MRLDATTGQIAKRFSVPVRGDSNTTATGIAFGAGSVWVARGAETVRVDPAGGNVVHRTLTPLAATSIVFAGGAVWVASAENGRVVKIDPAIDKITASTSLHATITDLAVGNGSVWVSIVPDNVVYRLSPDDGSVLATIGAGPWPAALSAGAGLWVADAKGRQIERLDSAGGRDVVPLSGSPLVTRLHGGLLWTSARAPERAVVANGQTLRILVDKDLIGDADPAQSFWPVSFQLEYATCAYLLNYADASGAAGRVLRPEVAAAAPDVSADGRIYTFRIRPGFRFSPPSGQAVTAETFKATIERALSPKLASGGRPNPLAELLPDVVGATAYAAGRAPHIAGITANGSTLTIRLTRAAGDLPERLRSPFFCPVPVGTPVVRGANPTPIPMAGPYRVTSAGGGQVVLERNPNYTGDRPRRIARIVYTDGFTASDAISRVEDGRADYVSGDTVSYDSTGRRSRRAARSTRRTACRAGRARRPRPVPTEPGPWDRRDRLQHATAAVRDVRMRRAVAYALDRRTLAAVFGERPTDRLVPAAIGGPAGNVAYPDEPDLALARRLAGTARGGTQRSTAAALPPTSASRRSSARTSPRSASTCTSTSPPDASPGPSRRSWLPPTCNSSRTTSTWPTRRRSSRCRSATPIPRPGTGGTKACEPRSSVLERRAAPRVAAYARLQETLVRDAVPVTVYGKLRQPRVLLGARRLQDHAGRARLRRPWRSLPGRLISCRWRSSK